MTIHVNWMLVYRVVRDLVFLVWLVGLTWCVIQLNDFDEGLSQFILYQMGMGQQEIAPPYNSMQL